MKGAPGVIIAALCMILACSSSQCSGLVHTAEPVPVGQLLSREGASPGRHLLASSPQSVQDLEGADCAAGSAAKLTLLHTSDGNVCRAVDAKAIHHAWQGVRGKASP